MCSRAKSAAFQLCHCRSYQEIVHDQLVIAPEPLWKKLDDQGTLSLPDESLESSDEETSQIDALDSSIEVKEEFETLFF